MPPLLYNSLMGAVDAIAILALSRDRTTRTWWTVGVAAAILANVLALILGTAIDPGEKTFAVVGLAAYGLFVHGSLLLGASAILLGKAARATAIVCATGMIVLLAVAVDAFWIEPTWLEVTEVRLSSPKLTRRLRIVVVADLQAETFGAYEREVLDRVMAAKPDLILFAGDYTQADRLAEGDLRRQINAYLRHLGLSAELGVFAVEGNVDHPEWDKIFAHLPVTMLADARGSDRTPSFSLGPVRLTLLTSIDSYQRTLKISNPHPEQYHIVLGHAPDFALGEIDADLLVAGHTHGGQVRLPLLGPVVTNSSLPRRMACGVSHLPSGAWLVVSRGIGMERGPAPRLRFLCRPELVIVDLEPEKGARD
jgi:predicted MPP superfamily phosphohydrolase